MTTDAERIRGGVVTLGGGFMISRYAKAVGVELGLEGGWTSYYAGRCGVLGAVDADVVTAALVFRPADAVREGWETVLAATMPAAASASYARACQEWGRAKLDGFAGAGRVAELCGLVGAEAEVAGLPLFAGWRAMPLPPDDEARAAQALHVLREHRGGLHAVAVLASGVTPLQAILAGPGGERNATFFGWTGPFEDVSTLAAARLAVEENTAQLVAPAYAVLDDAEQAELADLLDKAVAHVYPHATLEAP